MLLMEGPIPFFNPFPFISNHPFKLQIQMHWSTWFLFFGSYFRQHKVGWESRLYIYQFKFLFVCFLNIALWKSIILNILDYLNFSDLLHQYSWSKILKGSKLGPSTLIPTVPLKEIWACKRPSKYPIFFLMVPMNMANHKLQCQNLQTMLQWHWYHKKKTREKPPTGPAIHNLKVNK